MYAIVRPFGVTIVAVIAWNNGVVNIIQGIVSLLYGADPTSQRRSTRSSAPERLSA